MKKSTTLLVLSLLLGGCTGSDTPDEMHLAQEAAQYSGWVIIRKDLQPQQKVPGHFSKEQLDDDGWVFIKDLQWNSGGSRVPIVVDGVDTGYEVELAQVAYGDRIPVLKLAVYQQGVEMALAYTWAEPGSRRIGINLRWMQAGLTRK